VQFQLEFVAYPVLLKAEDEVFPQSLVSPEKRLHLVDHVLRRLLLEDAAEESHHASSLGLEP
jgi:hypothetical protein